MSPISQPQDKLKEIIRQLRASFEQGLSPDEVSSRREDAGHFNTVDPPIKCPAWICCLLPCIRHVPSMKAFQQIQPDDAEVKREGRWIRYDASALVRGDIIRIEEGDIVPADCIVLHLDENTEELLVDHRFVSGNEKPVSIKKATERTSSVDDFNVNEIVTLYWGGRVVLGSGIAVCIAVGPNTRVAELIRTNRFPPVLSSAFSDNTMIHTNTEISSMLKASDDSDRGDENGGIALLRQSSRDGISQVV
jgi:E1-E2 ATPase